MDLIKLFKRQKSVTKKEKSPEPSVEENSNSEKSSTSSSVDKPCDLNLNLKPTDSNSGKSWRKSIRKSFRKRKQTFQSNSCDNILHQGMSDNNEATSNTILSRHSNRWSYSPDHSGIPLDLGDMHETLMSRRHTEGQLLVEVLPVNANYQNANNSSHTFNSMPASVGGSNEVYRGNISNQSEANHTNRHMSTFKDPISPISPDSLSSNSAGYDRRKFDIQPHATLFEHEAESAFDHFHKAEKQKHEPENFEYEQVIPNTNGEIPTSEEYQSHEYTYIADDAADDNISWGSNEFSNSEDEEEEEVYDNEILEEGLGKVHNEEKISFFFRKNRESGKDITAAVRKLKFLQRKNALTKKVSREEELNTFIDVKLSKDRHPGPHLRPAPEHLLPYQSRRRNIVETIINSECSYIDSLERLEINYKKALLDAKPVIISSDHIEKIFYKIADILQSHQLFQIALAAAVNNWDDHETIGDTFVASFSKSMVLECYSSYINNFTSAMELVRKTCKQKPQFLAFLRERQNESQNRLNLYGLMLKPVQRFPQFIMLVQDLLKNTPNDHADRLPLQLALTELETLAENLNQRRADDEEQSEMIQLLESSNIKLMSNHTRDGRTRRLLKQGFVREQTFADDGTIEKDRECLLVLTNDMLLSCNCTNRRQQPRTPISTFRDLYKLKWCATLDILSVLDGHCSSTAIEYNKMQTDMATLQSICMMIEELNFPHQGLSVQQIEPCINSLEARMKQAEFDNNNSSDISFSVHFPQKSGDFKRTLVMSDSQHCNEWLESIINAKLANDSKNLHCWFSADGSDSEYLWKPPLFLESVKCQDSHKALQVQCAYAFMPANHITLLWLACSASTVLAAVNIYKIINEKTEKVHVMQVESSVQCMEHWNPYNESPSVWLGMECGSLIEFSADASYSKLCEVTMPTMSTVMIMKAFEKNLYVGLLDGSLLMYTRPDGCKSLVHVQSITVGSGPLNCLSPLDGKLWGASGNDLVTINLKNFEIESVRTIQPEEPLTVSHVVQVGSGLWVAFCDTCSLHLYHLDSLKLLQDLNLSRPIRDFFQGSGWTSRVNENCYITSMWSSYCQLLIGTSNGLVLTMPLPKLSGSVPKITGPCRICYHMLSGPVNFLCAPAMPPPKPKKVFRWISRLLLQKYSRML
uniref:rho guanine nucleotide exchange factor 10-like n=1 Tax=Styela clava TaxID=7725 RepID=UPI001939B42A|nr:rho guanine nucleotide exchange factor 10-like [Styela clava]